MVLYLSVSTDLADLVIDYIEVRLVTGETVSLNWDESDIERLDTGFNARYKVKCYTKVVTEVANEI